MIDFPTLTAKEAIREEAFSEYDKGMEFFYLELVHLNATIFIADQIRKTPLKLFIGPDRRIFFNTVLHNSFDAALLIITRLATDQGDGLYTLTRFRNKVREFVKPEYLSSLDGNLKKYRFDKITNELFKRARDLRNERVGHIREDVALGETEGTYLNFAELKSLRDALNSMLEALSFNGDHLILPVPYDPRVERPSESTHKTDIEDLLDHVISTSYLLNAPETNPILWEHWKAEFTGSEMEQINSYRKKYGLTSV